MTHSPSTPANPIPPGWPDPLESPQAEAIRNGKLDDTEIRNLFDCMERELRLHRERAANPAQVTDAMVKAAMSSPPIPGRGPNVFDEGRMRAALSAAIGAGGQAVQDTWFADRALPVRAMSGDAEDNRVLRLHFRRPVTDDDRKAMCDALNLHQASLTHPAPSGQAVALPTREEARQAARLLLRCNGADLSEWGGDDLHDDSAQDALKELSR